MKNQTLQKYPDLIKYRRKNIILPFVFCAVYYLVIIFAFYLIGVYEKHFTLHKVFIVFVLLIPIVLFKPFSFLFERDYKGVITDKNFRNELASTTGMATGKSRNNFLKEVVEHTISSEKGKIVSYDISNDEFDTSLKEMNTNFGSWKESSFKMSEKEIRNIGMKYEQGYPLIMSPLRDYYNVGDEVEHFAGFYYDRKLNLKHNEKNICIVCGALNNSQDDNCINCGYSIIK